MKLAQIIHNWNAFLVSGHFKVNVYTFWNVGRTPNMYRVFYALILFNFQLHHELPWLPPWLKGSLNWWPLKQICAWQITQCGKLSGVQIFAKMTEWSPKMTISKLVVPLAKFSAQYKTGGCWKINELSANCNVTCLILFKTPILGGT